MRGKVVIALNAAWNLVNFRAGLIRALVQAGYEVVAVAPYDNYAPRLPSWVAVLCRCLWTTRAPTQGATACCCGVSCAY